MKQILWTIQHRDAYEKMKRTGALRANDMFLFCQEDMRFAYDWMAKKLEEKVGAAPQNVNYPIWAWYQWEGKRKRRDMRCSGYAKRGTPMVQIAFVVEEDAVLLSDFDEWHHVLNQSYIADSEIELDRFYDAEKDNWNRILESWDKIFDLNRFIPGWTVGREEKSIQGVLWEVRIENVIDVQYFVAK